VMQKDFYNKIGTSRTNRPAPAFVAYWTNNGQGSARRAEKLRSD
jgi:hypothetical protein